MKYTIARIFKENKERDFITLTVRWSRPLPTVTNFSLFALTESAYR